MKFFIVIDEKVTAKMSEYFAEYQSAFDAMLKFSRKHGGSRNGLGMANGFGQHFVSVAFAKEPDRSVWKMTREKSGKFWVPKATKNAAEIKKEFDALSRAFPDKHGVYGALGYNPFSHGFAVFGKYAGVWVIAFGDDFKPSKKQQGKIKRISDVDYENLLQAEQRAETT